MIDDRRKSGLRYRRWFAISTSIRCSTWQSQSRKLLLHYTRRELNIIQKNVLISDYGRALITDFGISRIATTIKLDSTRGLDGTMRWTAPELLTKDSVSPTQESDIWSFGCVCYEVRHPHNMLLSLRVYAFQDIHPQGPIS